MIYAATAFAWVGGVASSSPVPLMTVRVEDGFCTAAFDSDEQGWIYGSCNLVVFVSDIAMFVLKRDVKLRLTN